MQLVRLRRRLADVKAILNANDHGDDESVTLTRTDFEQLVKNVAEADDAAEKIGFGHHSIVEVLNRI